jgi:Uma2 family endonuclease
MATHNKTITPDELLEMPDDGIRREIHDGVLVEMSPSGDVSTVIAVEIITFMRTYVRAHNLGRVTGSDGGFILSEDPYTLLVPDVGFVSRERTEPYTTKFHKLAPDLAVEVISPSERADDIFTKVQTYLQYGTRLVWIVYPKTRQVVVYQQHIENISVLDINDTLDGRDVLPGFTLPVRDIFAVLDE